MESCKLLQNRSPFKGNIAAATAFRGVESSTRRSGEDSPAARRAIVRKIIAAARRSTKRENETVRRGHLRMRAPTSARRRSMADRRLIDV
jgi:hypothetical protein